MSVDTLGKRSSAFNFGSPFDYILPPPDGSNAGTSGERGQLLGIYSGITVSAPLVAPGATYNAAEYFTTGATVTITLYDPTATDAASIPLDSSSCTETGSTGLFMWDMSKITTSPVTYKEYGYVMTDGTTSLGGIIAYDDFISQFITTNAMLN